MTRLVSKGGSSLVTWFGLCQCLRGGPQFEVVAVSGGSKDQTPAILERLAREEVRLVTKSVAWTQAYEEGLTLCQGEVVCLLDLAKQPAHKAGQAMERMLNE